MSIKYIFGVRVLLLIAAASACLADVNTLQLSEDAYWLDLFGNSWLKSGINRSGDFNSDGIVNFIDYAFILQKDDPDYIRKYFYLEDLALRKRNCQRLLKLTGSPCQSVSLPEDTDWLIWFSICWLAPERYYAGDFNEDGIVNFIDYAYMLQPGYPIYR